MAPVPEGRKRKETTSCVEDSPWRATFVTFCLVSKDLSLPQIGTVVCSGMPCFGAFPYLPVSFTPELYPSHVC